MPDVILKLSQAHPKISIIILEQTVILVKLLEHLVVLPVISPLSESLIYLQRFLIHCVGMLVIYKVASVSFLVEVSSPAW